MKKIAGVLLILIILVTGCNQQVSPMKTKTKDTITLTVFAGQSTTDAGIEDMIDEALLEKYPNVKLDWECVDWGEQFNTQMVGRFAAGDIPDIIIGKAQDVKAYALTGNFGPISNECSSVIKDEILKSVTVNGVVYGLPYNALYQGVLYNKQIFREYGLTVPNTQEELDHVIEVLQNNGVTPFAGHYQEIWQVGNMTMQFFLNDIFRKNATWGDDFRAGNEDFQTSEAVQRCLEYHEKILDNSWEDAMAIDLFESDGRFTEGKAAMYLSGSWSMQFADQYSKEAEFGIFPYPNEEGNSYLIRETSLTFMKSANTPYSQLVSDIFYDIITDEKLAKEILGYTQTSSVVKGIESVPLNKIQEDVDWYEANNKVIDAAIGNTQLVWEFQKEIAAQQLLWLNNEVEFQALLEFADKHRVDSKY